MLTIRVCCALWSELHSFSAISRPELTVMELGCSARCVCRFAGH